MPSPPGRRHASANTCLARYRVKAPHPERQLGKRLIATSVATPPTVAPVTFAATTPIGAAAAVSPAVRTATIPTAVAAFASAFLHSTHFLHHFPVAAHRSPHSLFGRVFLAAALRRRGRLTGLRTGRRLSWGRVGFHVAQHRNEGPLNRRRVRVLQRDDFRRLRRIGQ